MQQFTVFYCWQSDRPREVCKQFIHETLQEAVLDLNKESVGGKGESKCWVNIVLDSSAQESGALVISDAILRMIRESDVFLADVTPVSATKASKGRKSKRCANPNVAFELGYALNALSPRRIILVGNDAYGSLEDGFFDVRDKKQFRYRLCQDCTQHDRKTQQNDLRSRLSQELRKILGLGKFSPHDLNNQYSQWFKDRNQRREDMPVRFEGLWFSVDGRVFSPDPRLTNSSSMMAKFMPEPKGKDVLDLGTGCGALAILAALRGAKRVVAVDDDLHALANAQENVRRHGVERKVTVVKGNLFEPTEGEFDLILANLPIDPRGVWTSDVNELARSFLEQVGSKLSRKGVALLTWASFGDLDRLKEDLAELRIGFRPPKIEETFGVTWYLFEIVKDRQAK